MCYQWLFHLPHTLSIVGFGYNNNKPLNELTYIDYRELEDTMISERYLYKIEEGMALKQGRKPCDVCFADFPKSHKTVLSMFEKEQHVIVFNMELMDTLNELEIIASLIHEGRHAYQWQQILYPERSIEPKSLLQIWKAEFEQYNQPTSANSSIYLQQNIEIDAIAFASIQLELIGEAKLIIPEEIKALVLERKAIIKSQINI